MPGYEILYRDRISVTLDRILNVRLGFKFVSQQRPERSL
jgi:hypothetical protein